MTDQSPDLRKVARTCYAACALKATEGGTACCGPVPVGIGPEAEELAGRDGFTVCVHGGAVPL